MHRVFAVTSVCLALGALGSVGCASKPAPVAPVDHGVAAEETWLPLDDQAVTMRVPKGWRFDREQGVFVARAADAKAAMAIGGAATRNDLEAKVRALGASFAIEDVQLGKKRTTRVHGLDVDVYEDMAAVSKGSPADVLLMIADAPNGHGVAFVFVMAWDASQAHDLAIIDAANSLRPI